jgi:hypothetical protein
MNRRRVIYDSDPTIGTSHGTEKAPLSELWQLHASWLSQFFILGTLTPIRKRIRRSEATGKSGYKSPILKMIALLQGQPSAWCTGREPISA